ncbi:MAG: hypothetical protein R3C03_04775 [Pirellulaceae bacterium]
MNWHYFAGLAEGIGVGYHDYNWEFSLAAINGGRGIRLVDSKSRGELNNMAANLSYRTGGNGPVHLRLGGGFIQFDLRGLVAEHLDANQFGATTTVHGRFVTAWTTIA